MQDDFLNESEIAFLREDIKRINALNETSLSFKEVNADLNEFYEKLKKQRIALENNNENLPYSFSA